MLKDNSSSVGPIFQFPFQIDYLLIQLYAAIHFHTHSHHAFFRASSRTNSNRKNSNRGSNRIELNFESIDSWWIITNKRIESRWRRSASLITVSQPLAADRKAGYYGVRDTVWKTSVKKAGGSWRDRGKFIGESRASAIGKCASVYLSTTRKLPEGGAILHTCTHRRAHREEEGELVFTVTCKLSKRSLSPLWFFRSVLFLLRLRLISYTYLRWFGIWNFILWEVNCVWYLENYPNI